MPSKCCVDGCGARQGKDEVSFHRFPSIQTARDLIRRELWIEAAGMSGKDVSGNIFVDSILEQVNTQK